MPSGVMIVDKDGSMALELLTPGALQAIPVPSGDGRVDWFESINIALSGDTVVHTPGAGQRFVVESIAFAVSALSAIQFKSGTNALSGFMRLAANGGLALAVPVRGLMAGRTAGNTFVIATSGDGLVPKVAGFASGYDV